MSRIIHGHSAFPNSSKERPQLLGPFASFRGIGMMLQLRRAVCGRTPGAAVLLESTIAGIAWGVAATLTATLSLTAGTTTTAFCSSIKLFSVTVGISFTDQYSNPGVLRRGPEQSAGPAFMTLHGS